MNQIETKDLRFITELIICEYRTQTCDQKSVSSNLVKAILEGETLSSYIPCSLQFDGETSST